MLLDAALRAGAHRVVVGLGGSASMDGGAGCLAALGAGDPSVLRGADRLEGLPDDALSGLRRVRDRFADVDLVVATEEDVPLLGFKGAAASFAVAKGATLEQAQAARPGAGAADRPQDVSAALSNPEAALAARAERVARTWSR